MIVSKSDLVLFVLFIAACTSAMEPFIEGGQYAKIQSYPHSVYLYIECSAHKSCGGSILTQQIILTAGHCFEHCFTHSDITAYAGSEDIEKMRVAQRVPKFRIHKDYVPKYLYNDIALGLLESAYPLTDFIKRISIYKSFPGVKMARVTGWGVTNEATMEQTTLMKVVMQIIQPESVCKEIAGFLKGMFCAFNDKKNHPARGDSGSALVSKNGQQIGLVSWRHVKRRDVVMYTNVSNYYGWIHKQARQLVCSRNK